MPAKPKRLLELPTAAEIACFYGVIDNPIHKLIFETLENTGLRVAELCTLEVKRIDFNNNTIFVHKGKGGKDRVAIFGNVLKQKLLIYLEGRKNRYLFESNRHTYFSTRRIEQICKVYKAKVGIQKSLSPHTFRHIWNTRLANCGVSREHREILAGHEKGSKTQDIYTHLGIGGVKNKVIEILDKGDK